MKAFTDAVIKKITTKDKPRSITEGNGLYLRVTKSKKSWYHYFRIGSTRQWHRIGEYPLIGVADARKINAKLKDQTDRGEDPAGIALGDVTVKDLFQLWIDKAQSPPPKNKPWSPAHKYNVEKMFAADVLPKFGKVLVKNIRKHHIKQLLDAKEKTAPNQALQLYRRLSRLFNFAAELDILEASPMANLQQVGRQQQKERILSDDEIKIFITGLPGIDAADNTKAALELILRTGQRPSEICGMHRDEIVGDVWKIPSTRTKNGIAQEVYLHGSALDLLPEPNEHGLYFPSQRHPDQPISHGVLSKAIRRSITGREKRKDEQQTLAMEPFTPHDLRRTTATGMESLGINYLTISMVLNHKKNDVTGLYTRHDYRQEKIKAWRQWNIKIDSIVAGEENEKKVVKIY